MNFAQTIQTQAFEFLEKLFLKIQSHQILLPPHWIIDHLCYRVETETQYQEKKKLFDQIGECLIESEVNGRMIATFKLHHPIFFKNYQIDLIELPAPKKNKIVKEGFEHIEVVCDVPFDQIMNQYRHLKFDTSGLSKTYNQELEIELQGMSLKFHHQSLEDVIRFEKQMIKA